MHDVIATIDGGAATKALAVVEAMASTANVATLVEDFIVSIQVRTRGLSVSTIAFAIYDDS